MKIWTIQNGAVVETLLRDGFYQPDFSKSSYLAAIPKLEPLYDMLLSSFNRVNGCDLPGLVFAMTDAEREIPDGNAFLDFLHLRSPAIGSMTKRLINDNSFALELDYAMNFNPLLIDINDFQFLMPPVTMVPPYTEETFERILDNLQNGRFEPSVFPSGVIQFHLPYIRKENVVGIYKLR